jgi:hypothetical protein
MINLSTELVNDATVQRFVRECPERFTDIMETAINRAAADVRKTIKRDVPNKWGVNKDEMKNFRIKRAVRSHGELVARAILRGQSIKLIKFQNVSPRSVMGGKTKGGVSVMLAGQKHIFKHAFIAKLETGHLGIFERIGKFKTPEKGTYKGRINTRTGKPLTREIIKELTTMAVPKMAASERTDIPEKIAPMIQEFFENHFIKEAASWLSLLGAK